MNELLMSLLGLGGGGFGNYNNFGAPSGPMGAPFGNYPGQTGPMGAPFAGNEIYPYGQPQPQPMRMDGPMPDGGPSYYGRPTPEPMGRPDPYGRPQQLGDAGGNKGGGRPYPQPRPGPEPFPRPGQGNDPMQMDPAIRARGRQFDQNWISGHPMFNQNWATDPNGGYMQRRGGASIWGQQNPLPPPASVGGMVNPGNPADYKPGGIYSPAGQAKINADALKRYPPGTQFRAL